MNKFISGIVAGTSTLRSRATQVSNLIENSIKQNSIALDTKISDLEMKRANLLDFAPDTTDSLRPGNGKTKEDAAKFAKTLLEIDYELRELKIQKDLVEKELSELFDEVDETDGGTPAEIHD